MWGKQENPAPAPLAPPAPPVAPPHEEPKTVRALEAAAAVIGKSMVLKADVTGAEDLLVDGQLVGTINLQGHDLTIGPHGKVQANVAARNVFVAGTLEGNVQAGEKVEIRKTGSLRGDLTTAGVTIEDGAYFKGGIDIVRPPAAKAKAQA